MKKSLERYLNEELLPRITTYNKPNQSQKTIIHLINKSKTDELSDDELKILELEVTAEYAAEELYKKRQKANRARNEIEKKKKEKARKQLTREKIITGGLLLKMAENDSEMRQVLLKLFNSTLVAENDKDVLKRILERLNIPLPNSLNNELKHIEEMAEQYEQDVNPYDATDTDTDIRW